MTSIVENAKDLMSEPDQLLSALTEEVQGLYIDLKKLREKRNTTAGSRVRKSLMRLKKFADTGRKVAITDIKNIKKDRSEKRSSKASQGQDATQVEDSQSVQEDVVPEPVKEEPVPEPDKETSSKKKRSKKRSKKSKK